MMKNENGRSMVEMLGVLAIIGVLSVGGIAGYTMAMNKYKANEIAAVAAQCGVAAVAKKAVDNAYTGGACSDLIEINNSNVGTTNASTGVVTWANSITGIASSNIDSDKATVTVTFSGKSGVQKALVGLAGSVSNFTLAVSPAS